MKRLLFLISAIGLSLASPALAQLGAADSSRNVYFDAYCGKWGNHCKVYFRGTRMSVDNSAGIDGSQIESYSPERSGRGWTIRLYYTDAGEKKLAHFMFYEENQAAYFLEFVDSIRGKQSRSALEQLFGY